MEQVQNFCAFFWYRANGFSAVPVSCLVKAY